METLKQYIELKLDGHLTPKGEKWLWYISIFTCCVIMMVIGCCGCCCVRNYRLWTQRSTSHKTTDEEEALEEPSTPIKPLTARERCTLAFLVCALMLLGGALAALFVCIGQHENATFFLFITSLVLTILAVSERERMSLVRKQAFGSMARHHQPSQITPQSLWFWLFIIPAFCMGYWQFFVAFVILLIQMPPFCIVATVLSFILVPNVYLPFCIYVAVMIFQYRRIRQHDLLNAATRV